MSEENCYIFTTSPTASSSGHSSPVLWDQNSIYDKLRSRSRESLSSSSVNSGRFCLLISLIDILWFHSFCTSLFFSTYPLPPPITLYIFLLCLHLKIICNSCLPVVVVIRLMLWILLCLPSVHRIESLHVCFLLSLTSCSTCCFLFSLSKAPFMYSLSLYSFIMLVLFLFRLKNVQTIGNVPLHPSAVVVCQMLN